MQSQSHISPDPLKEDLTCPPPPSALWSPELIWVEIKNRWEINSWCFCFMMVPKITDTSAPPPPTGRMFDLGMCYGGKLEKMHKMYKKPHSQTGACFLCGLLWTEVSVEEIGFEIEHWSSSTIVPLESETVTTLAPRAIHFSVAYCATFPEPEILTRRPLKDLPFVASISSAKYTHPYPVDSGRMRDPPKVRPLPVKTHSAELVSFLYIPAMNPTSRPPTPMSKEGNVSWCRIIYIKKKGCSPWGGKKHPN